MPRHPDDHEALGLPHSPFPIPHSPFPIPHSPFPIPHSRSVPTLNGQTLFITGASRGIGLAIALRAARDGANVAIAAKSDVPNPKLPGTIHTAAQAVDDAGGARKSTRLNSSHQCASRMQVSD